MKDWLKKNWFKAGLLGIIFITGLSIVYYYVIFLPQKEQTRILLQQQEQLAKEQQEQKEYIAKRKMECYDVEEREREKWNNIDGSFYDEEKDECVVRYTTDEYKNVDCAEEYKDNSDLMFKCLLGMFTKRF